MDIYEETEQLIKKAKKIIATNTIKNSMRKISNLPNPYNEGSRLGTKKAFKIFSNILREKMKYIPRLHDNNIDLYFEQIKDQITEAYSYI